MADNSNSDSEADQELFTYSERRANPFLLELTMNGVPLKMELDTEHPFQYLMRTLTTAFGSIPSWLLLSTLRTSFAPTQATASRCWAPQRSKPSMVTESWCYPFTLSREAGLTLCKDWLSQLQVDLGAVYSVEPPTPLGEVLAKYTEVFK